MSQSFLTITSVVLHTWLCFSPDRPPHSPPATLHTAKLGGFGLFAVAVFYWIYIWERIHSCRRYKTFSLTTVSSHKRLPSVLSWRDNDRCGNVDIIPYNMQYAFGINKSFTFLFDRAFLIVKRFFSASTQLFRWVSFFLFQLYLFVDSKQKRMYHAFFSDPNGDTRCFSLGLSSLLSTSQALIINPIGKGAHFAEPGI